MDDGILFLTDLPLVQTGKFSINHSQDNKIIISSGLQIIIINLDKFSNFSVPVLTGFLNYRTITSEILISKDLLKMSNSYPSNAFKDLDSNDEESESMIFPDDEPTVIKVTSSCFFKEASLLNLFPNRAFMEDCLSSNTKGSEELLYNDIIWGLVAPGHIICFKESSNCQSREGELSPLLPTDCSDEIFRPLENTFRKLVIGPLLTSKGGQLPYELLLSKYIVSIWFN